MDHSPLTTLATGLVGPATSLGAAAYSMLPHLEAWMRLGSVTVGLLVGLATLGAIQAQYGNPRHVAAPVPLTDGRLMLCADLLTETGPGGLYAQGFAHLPAELFPQVAIFPMAEAVSMIPQADSEI